MNVSVACGMLLYEAGAPARRGLVRAPTNAIVSSAAVRRLSLRPPTVGGIVQAQYPRGETGDQQRPSAPVSTRAAESRLQITTVKLTACSV